LPPPVIVTRSAQDETLFPNTSNCRRFAQLSSAFAARAAGNWNHTPEMAYLNKKLGKWTAPEVVAVDSHPRLSGIMDTVNSTLSHGPLTRLPAEFYDERVRQIINRVAVEEWFQGYRESKEYRTVGIGGLVGDIVTRMVGHVNMAGSGDSAAGTKMAMSGCHDTTLAALGHSLGAFSAQTPWPPYTSSIAFELFKTTTGSSSSVVSKSTTPSSSSPMSWLTSMFTRSSSSSALPTGSALATRTPLTEMTTSAKDGLAGYYVRIRYNDEIYSVPGCRAPGKHLEGNESFCTLEAFKAVADKFTPKSWKTACSSNLDKDAFPAVAQEPGY